MARKWIKSGAIGNEMRTNMSFGHNIRNICQSISDNIKEHIGDWGGGTTYGTFGKAHEEK